MYICTNQKVNGPMYKKKIPNEFTKNKPTNK